MKRQRQNQVKQFFYYSKDEFLSAKRQFNLKPAVVYQTMGPHWCDIHWAVLEDGKTKRPYYEATV